ncbi:YncE family protein, partial [Streptomyces virginiae]
AYVANSFSDTVSVIDTRSNMVRATIPVGTGPRGVAVAPYGSRIYVTNSTSDDVSVIDNQTNTVIEIFRVGDSPIGIAIGITCKPHARP